MEIKADFNKQNNINEQINVKQITGLSQQQIEENKEQIERWLLLRNIIVKNKDDIGTFKYFMPKSEFQDKNFEVWPPKKSLLIYASQYNSYLILQYLADNLQFNLEVRDPDNLFTPVHYACYYGQPNILKFLLKKGAKIDKYNESEETPEYTIRSQINLIKSELKTEIFRKNIKITLLNLQKCQEILNNYKNGIPFI